MGGARAESDDTTENQRLKISSADLCTLGLSIVTNSRKSELTCHERSNRNRNRRLGVGEGPEWEENTVKAGASKVSEVANLGCDDNEGRRGWDKHEWNNRY